MATFAELQNNRPTERIIAVNEGELIDENNVRSEAKGVAFCQSLFGGNWVEVPVGNYVWDETAQQFIPGPKPFNSWIWVDGNWVPPTNAPENGLNYRWSEEEENWVLLA